MNKPAEITDVERNCGRCGRSISPTESDCQYFGWHTTHSPNRCVEILRLEILALSQSVAERDARIASLEKALQFYADMRNYRPRTISEYDGTFSQDPPEVYDDDGDTARAALTPADDAKGEANE